MSDANDDERETNDDVHDAGAAASDERAEIREQKMRELLADDSPAEPVHVESEAHLEELIEGDDVVIVDFYADWCGPCQMMEPAIGAVAETMPATVAKVDVDEHQAIAREYRVQSVPTLVVFADGERVERLTGLQDEVTLGRIVEQYE